MTAQRPHRLWTRPRPTQAISQGTRGRGPGSHGPPASRGPRRLAAPSTTRALLVVVALLTAGCLGGGPQADGNGGPGQGDPSPRPPPWPEPGQADVRPGAGIGNGVSLVTGVAPGASCTANFLFASPDNSTLFIGTAAHCLPDTPLGMQVRVGGPGGVATTLAYSSWQTMNTTAADHRQACARLDVSLDDSRVCWNDLALLEIDPVDRHRVHPAMLGFGGPTGLAEAGAAAGDRVLTFGDSWRREAGGDTVDGRAGVVLDANEWRVLVHVGVPGTEGDSGSPVILDDGRALGVMTYHHLVPPGVNGVSRLDRMLSYAHDEAGFDVDLVTWPLLLPLPR